MAAKLPKWFRHMLGFATFLLAVKLGDLIGMALGPMIFGILAWIFIAKGGEFKKRGDQPEGENERGKSQEKAKWFVGFFSGKVRPAIWIPVVFLFLLVITIGDLYGPPSSLTSINPSGAMSGTSYRTKQGFFGCTTRTALDRAFDFRIAKDYTALAKMIATGLCTHLKPAMPVVTEDVAPREGVIKIRVKGEIAGVWTAIEAIEPVGNPFNVGDRLVNRHKGTEIGVVLKTKMAHTFPNGTVGRAYFIKQPNGFSNWSVAERTEQIGRVSEKGVAKDVGKAEAEYRRRQVSLNKQLQGEQLGAKALRSAIGDEPGVISVIADVDRRGGIVISLRANMWNGLSGEQKQALVDRFMAIVLQGNGNTPVPITVMIRDSRVAVAFNIPMRMVLLQE
ncbi:MAG: hypothetical protein ACE5E2_04495 [Candidatus Binatia bacterium]